MTWCKEKWEWGAQKKKLSDLADVEFLVFENTGVVLLKTGVKGYFTPDIKKPVALTHLFRKKIACTLDRLKVHGSNKRKKVIVRS